jgi:hypothetical protein
MIDYTKIIMRDLDTKRLISLKELDFKLEVSESTGEISYKRISEYHFCKIIVFDNGLTQFQGSIHKLWNSINGITPPNYKISKKYSGFNGNKFSLDEIYKVRTHLEKLFDCKSKYMIFKNIEFGLNLLTGYCPKKFIKGLLYHRNKPFEFRYGMNYAQANHQKYFLKIYNKSYQYLTPEYILRIEVKIIRSMELKKMGIQSFYDIKSDSMNTAREFLLNYFKEIVHYDYTINTNSLSLNDAFSIKNYSNINFWLNDLKPNHRDRHKKKLNKITRLNSNELKKNIQEMIKLSDV